MESDCERLLTIDFQRRLRWVILVLIAITAVAQLMLLPALPNLLSVSDLIKSEILLLVFAIWDVKVDYSRLSAEKQIASLLIEICLVGFAGYYGFHKLYQFLMLSLVAKGAAALRLKPLIGVMFAAYGVQSVCNAMKATEYYQSVAMASGGLLPHKHPIIITVEQHFYFIFALIVVAAMVRSMVSERRNRLRAEQLSDDIEALIVKNERSRISRDIHDGLGHTLTSLNIQLDVAKTLFSDKPDVAREALVTAKDLASDSLAEVRRSVHLIREEDSTFNLSEAVQSLVARAQNNHDVEIELSLETEDLPLVKAHNLFCIVQEAITNAQRHAHAHKIQIEFKKEQDHLNVQVADDGVGFDTSSELRGFGLRSMTERADNLGGTLRLESSPGTGTKVNVQVPL
jgi:signal transduction histidine kinase